MPLTWVTAFDVGTKTVCRSHGLLPLMSALKQYASHIGYCLRCWHFVLSAPHCWRIRSTTLRYNTVVHHRGTTSWYNTVVQHNSKTMWYNMQVQRHGPSSRYNTEVQHCSTTLRYNTVVQNWGITPQYNTEVQHCGRHRGTAPMYNTAVQDWVQHWGITSLMYNDSAVTPRYNSEVQGWGNNEVQHCDTTLRYNRVVILQFIHTLLIARLEKHLNLNPTLSQKSLLMVPESKLG